MHDAPDEDNISTLWSQMRMGCKLSCSLQAYPTDAAALTVQLNVSLPFPVATISLALEDGARDFTSSGKPTWLQG